MAVSKEVFGETRDGKVVDCYTITNKNGMRAEVITYGAILKSLFVPDKKGKAEDVVLGYDKLWMYFKNGSCFGATIGPIANRTREAAYKVDGKKVKLPVNDHGANNLHSDLVNGFHKRVWEAEAGKNSVTFSLFKKDKDMGHPGNMKVSVTYTLTDKNELKIDYHATTDKKTVINMTNHSYFNLSGPASASMLDTMLTIHASRYTEVDGEAIPTGNLPEVKGTPMDFTKAKKIGRDIGKKEFTQIKLCGGFDHNYCIDGYNGKKKLAAEATDARSGRKMLVYTDLPGVQFYAGNFIGKNKGKGGYPNGPRKGFCLETQYYPDAANHADFPQPVFGPEKEYKTSTVYQFSW
ncbi:MAG: galactose mutarotase [Lachnospiraceae bacterium]|nr:galactose mutarotase [Lachnospiraceae bacterium]